MQLIKSEEFMLTGFSFYREQQIQKGKKKKEKKAPTFVETAFLITVTYFILNSKILIKL